MRDKKLEHKERHRPQRTQVVPDFELLRRVFRRGGDSPHRKIYRRRILLTLRKPVIKIYILQLHISYNRVPSLDTCEIVFR
jgi:hypothetical protein